ncbi:hypothetical protein [uncultured Sphingomonas sp.]|uniref:hypothetical protein n=1 Tax=uncultured Sphingomonas sp. TaxID=158754 RepID=UPI0025EB19FE|nr:hypothetical protein [uncultured Sphingomonas sp.]
MILAFLLLVADEPPSVPPAAWDDRDAAISLASQRLRWPTGTRLEVADRDGELVVRTDRAIDAAAIDALRRSAAPAIADLRWNDQSLVLRAAPPWRIAWRRDGATLALTFLYASDPVAPTSSPSAADTETIDVTLAAIEASAAAGYSGEARRTAETLVDRFPEDSRALRALADARSANGDVRGADALYHRLGADDRAARRARAFAPGTASVTATVRDGGDLTQVEVAARVDSAVNDTVTIAGGLRYIYSRVETVAGDIHARSQIAEGSVTVRLDDDVRATVLAASALDTGVTGGGVRFVAGASEFQVRGGAFYRLPDYSTGKQALAAGALSRVGIGGAYRVAPGLYAQLDGAWNQYGLAGAYDASDTVTLAGGLDYLIRRGSPSITLAYRLDAEYVLTNRRPAALTLIDRENHSLLGIGSATLGATQLTGQLGYTVDRFGGDGPNVAIGLSSALGDGWRIEGSGGLTSVSRTGFDGRQLFGRAQITRGLGPGR